MAPDLKAVTFRLEKQLLDGLLEIKARDGIPVTEQVRRAIQAWLHERDPLRTDRKGAVSRKRP